MKLKKIRISKNLKEIKAKNIKCMLDDKGFFLIRIENKQIEVGFCDSDFVMTHKFMGKDVEKLYKTIVKELNIENKQHLAYLGMELEKARVCLDFGLEYVQDEKIKKQ